MKHIIGTLFLLCCALTAAAAGRSVRISGTPEKITKIAIVKANGKPVVAYAAKELQTFLEQAMGQKPAIVSAPAPGCFTVVLGDGEFARKAGLDVNKLPPEGFYLRRAGNVLFIAGRDSDTETPAKPGVNVFYPRATLTGVYDFLERFAGARFFFSGPFGTVVPARGALSLPPVIDVTEAPDMFFRRFSLYGRANEALYAKYNVQTLRRDLLPKLREPESRYPFGHGLNGLDLIRRFAKPHPEYFALMENGQRYCDPKQRHPGQLCFSSGVREVIIQDAIAYYSGKAPETRGLKRWPAQTAWRDLFGIMPQDGMVWCRCDKCKKVWDGKGSIRDEGPRRAISEFMFRFYAEVCQRLTAAGFKPRVATMAYMPYNIPPSFPLPKELLVQVAVTGLGGTGKNDRTDTERLKAWYEKTGNKVTAWTYAMGKHMNKVIPGVPAMMPRHAANFIKTNAKYLDGVYFESETDAFLFNYLNYYVVMRLMWNSSLDVEELLADHFRVMFGKGAPFMAEFYADLEKNWTEKILGNTVETDLGPVTKVPSTREIWEKIYSPAKMKHYNDLFDKALAAAGNDKGAASRLNYIRKELLGAIVRVAEKNRELQRGMDFWIARVPGTVWLRSFAGDTNEVNTRVTLRKENNCLIVRAECEEPRMKELAATCTKNEDIAVFKDSAFEILLNPSGDRKNYFQFGVNANGALTDARCRVNARTDFSWNSGAAAKAGKEKNFWWAEVTIPLKSLGALAQGGFPANFCRNRVLITEPLKNPYSMWSLFAGTRRGGFHAIDSWGKISFDPAPVPLIPNGNFEKIDGKTGKPENWRYWSKPGITFVHDERCFISGGRSLRIDADGTRNGAVSCAVPAMKPGKKYRLSFFVKTEGVKGSIGAGAWIYFFNEGRSGTPLPKVRLTGTNPWHRLSFEFTAPPETGKEGVPATLGLWIWKAKGKVWYDEVRLEELP